MRVRWVLVIFLGVILSLSACSMFERVFGGKKAPSYAPAESLRPEPYGPTSRPGGYNAAIAWLNVCQRDRSGSGYALIYKLSLVGVRSDGAWLPVYEQVYTHSDHIAGGLFTKSPWFAQMLEGQSAFTLDTGALRVPTGTRPDCVYHPWQSRWPRPSLLPEVTKVLAVADIQCFGNAVAQVGADYWPEPGSTTITQPPPQVVESGASRWVSATDGRVTIRIGE